MAHRRALFPIRFNGRLFGGAERFRKILAFDDYFADRDLPTSCGVAAGFLPDESDVADDFHLLSYYLDLDGCGELYRHPSFTQEKYKAKYALDRRRRIKDEKRLLPDGNSLISYVAKKKLTLYQPF